MKGKDRKSDDPIVPVKRPNKGDAKADPAEVVEGRGSAKRKQQAFNTGQTQSWETVQSKLLQLHQKAKAEKTLRFTALMHHVYDPEVLRQAYFNLRSKAAPGIDGKTYHDYGLMLEENLARLAERLKRGAYHAKPVRRVYIPKRDGTKRPLGILVIEDKIVQRAVTMVLKTIYEADFVGFSYGFRPKRNQHQALYALTAGIMIRRINWILDADIQNFFGKVDHEWLIKFMEHRIADARILRLIRKWLKAGVMEAGMVSMSEEGTPQGGSISPLLANIYLHYVFDLWTKQWRSRYVQGDVIAVRYADDTVVGFQYKQEADRYLTELTERMAKFGLTLNQSKTSLFEFGRYATERCKKRGFRKPKTFEFLGLTHACRKTREDKFTVRRLTVKKRMREKLQLIKTELRRRMHHKIAEVGKWLRSVLRGHYRYYGVSGNFKAMEQFRYQIMMLWRSTLRRRSQQRTLTWESISKIATAWLPKPEVYHIHPLAKIGVIT